jgi:hypothetical protein
MADLMLSLRINFSAYAVVYRCESAAIKFNFAELRVVGHLGSDPQTGGGAAKNMLVAKL